MALPKVIITGAGGGGASNLISTIKARTDYFLIGLDISPQKAARANVDRRIVVPPASDPSYDKAIGEIVVREGADLILPSNDPEVEKLSGMRRQLGTRLFFPDHHTVSLCLDKWKFHRFAAAAGIRVAETRHVESLDDLDDIFADLNRDLLWCRAIKGAGSRAATMVKDPDQARWWIKYWNEMRGTKTTDFTLSEFLPGRDFACQSTWRNGELVLMKAAERLSYIEAAQRPSNMSSSPEHARTVHDKELFAFCIDAIKKLSGPNANGNYGVDIKMNANNQFCVTEMNVGRFFMISNVFNLSGKYSMIDTYLELALGRNPRIDDPFDYSELFLTRSIDTLPTVMTAAEIAGRVSLGGPAGVD